MTVEKLLWVLAVGLFLAVGGTVFNAVLGSLPADACAGVVLAATSKPNQQPTAGGGVEKKKTAIERENEDRERRGRLLANAFAAMNDPKAERDDPGVPRKLRAATAAGSSFINPMHES